MSFSLEAETWHNQITDKRHLLEILSLAKHTLRRHYVARIVSRQATAFRRRDLEDRGAGRVPKCVVVRFGDQNGIRRPRHNHLCLAVNLLYLR